MARPKSFIPEEALEKAMHVFWDKGYEAASIQDLTEAMGINRFSLYDTFGDKHDLFLQCLDRYFDCVASKMSASILEDAERGAALDAVEAFLRDIVEQTSCPDHACRCLYQRAATEVAPGDAAVRERIARLHDTLRETYARVLGVARARGELAEGVRVPDAAWSLVILHMGLVALDAAPPPRRAALAAVRTAISPLRADS